MGTDEKNRYFQELALNLRYEGFTAKPEIEEHLLLVELDGQRLCRVTSVGEVRYWKENAADDHRRAALDRVTSITRITAEYMRQMETAPRLTASGLTGDYRLLADFNDVVLAGHPMTLNGGGMPMERYQEVDGWKEALWLIRSGSGTVTPYGVVYDNGMALEPLYNDRAMQALYALALDPVSETTADSKSFGFRKGRCAQDACEYIFGALSKKCAPKWILEGDIKWCFDHISHDWLTEHIPLDKSVLKQFLKAGFVFQEELFPTDEGTPQGGVISPILANMTLDGMQELLSSRFHKNSQGGVSVGRGQGCHPDQTSGTQGLAVVHSGGQERGLLHIGNGP